MTPLIIHNIKYLVNTREEHTLLRGRAMQELPLIENAWLYIEDGTIKDYGSGKGIPEQYRSVSPAEYVDAKGGSVLPCWCDSHTHVVFAGSRENEFVYKLKGMSYAEIAAKGGGILSSAKAIEEIAKEELYELSRKRVEKLIALGTGAIEIKSGYGLSVAGELKMLRVIQRLKRELPIPVKATFLGAHTYPPAYKQDHEGYIRLIIDEMLPVIAREKLADYIDVFCEEGFFSVEEARKIIKAGKQYGLKPKIHANQLAASGGVELGIEEGALSVDHLETMNQEAIAALSESNTIGTLLPTAAFYLRMGYQPARTLIDEQCAIALASDFNPGSSPSGNMNFVVSLSCIQMKMLPEEAINAATLNGAYAMELESAVGSITPGKRANFILTNPIPSVHYLPYAFGENHIQQVYINGKPYILQEGVES